MAFETIKIPSASVGNQAHIHLHRFGPEGVKGVKKVYIQAGLHADEHPGLLVAQHLLRHLEQLDQQNVLKAEIVLVPFANPVGLRQKNFGLCPMRHQTLNRYREALQRIGLLLSPLLRLEVLHQIEYQRIRALEVLTCFL